MDLDKIRSVITNQLQNTTGIKSLKIQNHIYGCFILMEDIAQKVVNLSETVISTPKFTLDLDKQFSEIGLRYGFAMDTKLSLDNFNPEYKETWLQYFKDIDLSQDIAEVDKIEDCLIEVIQSLVSTNDAFFINSLNTGSLPQEWIEKLFTLLNSPIEEDTKIDKTATTTTKAVEKPRRHLTTTRKSNLKIHSKKALAKTRRHH